MRLKGVTSEMASARDAMTDHAFQRSATILNQNQNSVRETLQHMTSGDIRQILDRLQSGKAPTPGDLDIIKLWIVGDADSYTRMENNFEDWLEEYARLEDILKEYEEKDCDAKDLFRLQGILEDAIRVSYDISNFLEKQERLARFEATVKDKTDWDRDSLEFLVGILTEKLYRSDV